MISFCAQFFWSGNRRTFKCITRCSISQTIAVVEFLLYNRWIILCVSCAVVEIFTILTCGDKNICAREITSTVLSFFCASRATEIFGFGRTNMAFFFKAYSNSKERHQTAKIYLVDLPNKFRKKWGSFLSRGRCFRGAKHVIWSWYNCMSSVFWNKRQKFVKTVLQRSNEIFHSSF